MRTHIPLADPLIDEEEAKAVYDVVKTGWIREGKMVDRFEREFSKYAGTKHAIVTSSGTAALHVALMSLGIRTKDEVIVPSFTCSPPISMTLLVGGKPVLVDIETETYNIDVESVRRMISKKTRAIIPINYAGHPAELDALEEIADEKGLYLLNDAAEALGSTYRGKNVAEYGDVAIFSFSPNKTLTTGEGGMIATDDDEIAERVRMFKNYGQKERFCNVELGGNYRITEMQAAIGLIQLKKVEEIITRKRENAQALSRMLSDINGIVTPVELEGCFHVYMLYSIRILSGRRDEVGKQLEAAGIQNRIYFPAMHKMPMMEKYLCKKDDLRNTELVSSTILSLPSSPKLSIQDREYISETMHRVFAGG